MSTSDIFFSISQLKCRLSISSSYRTVSIAMCEIFSGFVSQISHIHHEPLGEWNNSKMLETRKTFATVARGSYDNYVIVKYLIKSNISSIILIIQWYTISQFKLHMCKTSMLDKLQHGVLDCCENQDLF